MNLKSLYPFKIFNLDENTRGRPIIYIFLVSLDLLITEFLPVPAASDEVSAWMKAKLPRL